MLSRLNGLFAGLPPESFAAAVERSGVSPAALGTGYVVVLRLFGAYRYLPDRARAGGPAAAGRGTDTRSRTRAGIALRSLMARCVGLPAFSDKALTSPHGTRPYSESGAACSLGTALITLLSGVRTLRSRSARPDWQPFLPANGSTASPRRLDDRPGAFAVDGCCFGRSSGSSAGACRTTSLKALLEAAEQRIPTASSRTRALALTFHLNGGDVFWWQAYRRSAAIARPRAACNIVRSSRCKTCVCSSRRSVNRVASCKASAAASVDTCRVSDEGIRGNGITYGSKVSVQNLGGVAQNMRHRNNLFLRACTPDHMVAPRSPRSGLRSGDCLKRGPHEKQRGGPMDLCCHTSQYRVWMSDDAFYRRNRPATPPRKPRPGEPLWSLLMLASAKTLPT